MKAHISHSATAVELVNKKRIEKEVRCFFAVLDEYDFDNLIHKAQQVYEEAEEISLEVMPQNQYENAYMYGCVHGYISQLVQKEIYEKPISVEQAANTMLFVYDIDARLDNLVDPEEDISITIKELYYAGVDAMRGEYPDFLEDAGLYSIRAIVNSGKEIVDKNEANLEKINHWIDEFIRVAKELSDEASKYNGTCLIIDTSCAEDSILIEIDSKNGIAPATTTIWGQVYKEYSGRETLIYMIVALMCDLGGSVIVDIDEEFDDDMNLNEFLASQNELMRLEYKYGENETVYSTKLGRKYFGDI